MVFRAGRGCAAFLAISSSRREPSRIEFKLIANLAQRPQGVPIRKEVSLCRMANHGPPSGFRSVYRRRVGQRWLGGRRRSRDASLEGWDHLGPQVQCGALARGIVAQMKNHGGNRWHVGAVSTHFAISQGCGPKCTELTEKPLDRRRPRSRWLFRAGSACCQPTATAIQPSQRAALRSQIVAAHRASRSNPPVSSHASDHAVPHTLSIRSFLD
jgi:hypothetical protein